jgi:hypothetical protein
MMMKLTWMVLNLPSSVSLFIELTFCIRAAPAFRDYPHETKCSSYSPKSDLQDTGKAGVQELAETWAEKS